jgi:predicted nuclease of predicted toxin-antitoxin system
LREQGHDTIAARDLGRDPGDQALLERAVAEKRILVTIDTDFGELVFRKGEEHTGLIRLPDVPAAQRIALVQRLLHRYRGPLEQGAIITIRGGRVRVSTFP